MSDFRSVERRQVSSATVEEYLAGGVPGVFPIPGSPPAMMVVDPGRKRLALRVNDRTTPDVSQYRRVGVEEYFDGMTLWQELGVALNDNPAEVHAMLVAIADRMQLDGEDFATATVGVLESLEDILSPRSAMSSEQQLGLFGELLVLRALIEKDPEVALEGWTGPLEEEHDFVTDHYDLEVKTTTAERREHWISGIDQLTPSPNRPLLLASIQLTRAPIGQGHALPDLVDEVRSAAVHRDRFEDLLFRTGYRDVDRDLMNERWMPRSRVAFYDVGDRFPRLTQVAVASAVAQPERIREVRYRIDLTGLDEVPAPLQVDGPGRMHTNPTGAPISKTPAQDEHR